jgi:hypothetical protein
LQIKLPSGHVSRLSSGHDSIEQLPPEQVSLQVEEDSQVTVQFDGHSTVQLDSPRQTAVPPAPRSNEQVAWSVQNPAEESPASMVQTESSRQRKVLRMPTSPWHSEVPSQENSTAPVPAP